MGTEKAISAYDVHFPHTNQPTLSCLLQFTAAQKPDYFIFGGDQLDMGSISHHNKSKPFYRTKAAYLNDITGFDKHVLTPVEKVLPKNCQKVWIIGNHEDWERQHSEENPELAELVDHVRLLSLRARGWKVIELGHAFTVGRLNYIHGEWLTGIGNQAGTFPSKKLVEVYAANVVAGHTHAPQSYTRVSPVNQRERWMGWVSPVLCDLNPAYLRNRPTAWINGFNLTEFQPDGCFNHYPLICPNGRVAYGGKVYGKK